VRRKDGNAADQTRGDIIEWVMKMANNDDEYTRYTTDKQSPFSSRPS
jgi:hypothetical protein